MTGRRFRDYVESCLVPTLRPGDVVVIDTVSSHKSAAARAAIVAAGRELRFLPAHGPDLNPMSWRSPT